MRAPQDPPAFASLEWPGDVRDAAAGTPWWLAVAAVSLAVASLWWWCARRRPVPVRAAAAPVAAATALARLRALALPESDAAIAAFYAQVKALVRLHCRERFGVRAEASTSEELVRAQPGNRELAACLAACDLVLFAAGRPGATHHAASLASAIAFAIATGSDGAVGAEVA